MMQRSIYSKAALCCILSFFFLIICIGKATIMQTALTNSLTICLTTILPSLTAMMILTRILTESGLLEQWNFLFGRLFHFLFRLPTNFCSIFFISQIAGYPVGAAMLRPYFQTHANAKKELSAITSVCFGGGPAFLIGTVGAQFSNHRPCMYLFLSGFLANALLAIVLGRCISISEPPLSAKPVSFSAELLVSCTRQASQNLLGVCSMILCCAAPIGMLNSMSCWNWISEQIAEFCTASPRQVQTICNTFLEISNICTLSVSDSHMLPILAGLLSFGGICVLLQVSAVTHGQCQFGILFGMRFLAGCLSAGFCWLLLQLVPLPEATTASLSSSAQAVMSPAVSWSGNSCMPGLFLTFMIVLFLLSCDKKSSSSSTIYQ